MMDRPNSGNFNYQQPIAGVENTRPFSMPTARFNGQTVIDPSSANQLPMATRQPFYGNTFCC